MSRNRWLLIVFCLALLPALVALGIAISPTAAASPPLQVATDTATATDVITSTATTTATVSVTETPTETATPIGTTPTETATPIGTTPTETATPIGTTPTETATPGPVTLPFWNFAAKFVCGAQPADQPGQPIAGEPIVQPGSYATEINIHNPHYLGPIHIRTKLLLLVDRGAPVGRAPNVVEPPAFSPLFALPDDGATMEDCNSLWERLNPGTPPPDPMPLMVGYLVIVSPANLDVVSVMTASASTSNLEPAGIAMQTIAVEGRRVLIPATVFPDNVLPREREFTDQ